MYIDTHCHYDLKQFKDNLPQLLKEIMQCGVERLIVPAIAADSNIIMREKLDMYAHPELISDYGITPSEIPEIFFSAGLHPTRVWKNCSVSEKEWDTVIRKSALLPSTVAIGETGLDYHLHMNEEMHEKQSYWFHKQLMIAEEYQLPLILHIRLADNDAINILRQYPLRESGVVHCFNMGAAVAEEYLALGLYFGIGGAVTFNDTELHDAVKIIPMERIILETDAPYVKPVWCSESYNTSKNIPLIAKTIADIKGISPADVERITTKNAFCLFSKMT